MNLLLQTTQPAGWSPEAMTALIAGLVTLVGAIAAAVVSVIVAWKASNKATEAKATSDANTGRMDRLSERTSRVEDKAYEVAKAAAPEAFKDKP